MIEPDAFRSYRDYLRLAPNRNQSGLPHNVWSFLMLMVQFFNQTWQSNADDRLEVKQIKESMKALEARIKRLEGGGGESFRS